jgi:hypothetical protein
MLLASDWPPQRLRRPMSLTDVTSRARTQRLGSIRAELLTRIRPVCPTMPQELFLEMVESMAAIQLKYELRNTDERMSG